MTVLLIDNYDSFTYNLYQVISSQTDEKVVVYRNDEIFTDEIALISPSSIVFSPGPGHPANVRDFGICREIIEQYGNKIPMLGVCLGHQGMGLCFGGSLTSAHKILHGKTSSIRHSGTGIFQDIPQDIQVARYHSLILQNENLPDTLEITAITSDKTIMGIAHKSFPIFGIQFHPESFMTEFGTKMIRNFLTLAKNLQHENKEYGDNLKFKNIFSKIVKKRDLGYEESRELMGYMMSGELSNTQIAGLLTALRMKGETFEEIAGLSQAMQELTFPIDQHPDALDVVGTGGATFKTFNVSTMTGLVLSSMGIKVAKHGNRSSTSKCGSADFLEGLGLNLRLDPAMASNILERYKFIFLFAPFYHRSMKHAIKARKELAIRTVFNILGPLTNPVGVKQQLIGVFDHSLLLPIAKSLRRRGHKRAAVVYNEVGADEIMNIGTTQIVEVKQDNLDLYEVTVDDFGLSEMELLDLRNRSVSEAILEAHRIMDGEITPIAEFVAINGAMAMRVAGKGESLSRNTSEILDHIASGKTYDHVRDLIAASGGELVESDGKTKLTSEIST